MAEMPLAMLLLTGSPMFSAAKSVADYVVPCVDDAVGFDVKLNFDDGSSYNSACSRSYSRCPDGSCLGGDDDWSTESNRSFDYLQTHTFAADGGASPAAVYVNDRTGQSACARALYMDQYRDFSLGSGELDVGDWWAGRAGSADPLQITIVPFNSDQADCDKGNFDFEAERTVAVWVSASRGQDSDPNDGSVYCDLSQNPEDCLNFAYWTVEHTNWGVDEIVLHGTLAKVLDTSPPAVNIYLPEGYDLNMPITNHQLRFQIADGSTQACQDYVNGNGQSTCMVNKLYSAAEMPNTPLADSKILSKITVSGLGRISGWDAMEYQRSKGYYLNCGESNKYCFNNVGGGSGSGVALNDASTDWGDFAQWYMSGRLLDLSAKPPGYEYGSQMFAIDVSGIETSWGSKYGYSPIQLNVADEDTYNYPTKVFDFKYVGNFNDQGDGIDTMADGSFTAFAYTQTNDDNIKLSAKDNHRKHSTLLQGRAGCAINLGAYGWGNIDGSVIEGVYVHRILHASWDSWNGCASGMDSSSGNGYGGLICTRSCALNDGGLVDTTITGLYVPELADANSVSRLFAIGVNGNGPFCPGTKSTKYPIRNLVIKDSAVYPNPGCMSAMYDDLGIVEWGYNEWPSVRFFDEDASDTQKCDFQGTLNIHDDPQYFVCGFSDQTQAAKYCMTTDGVGGSPNIEYSIVSGDNPNVVFPTCGYSSSLLAVA